MDRANAKTETTEELRQSILRLVDEYARSAFSPKPFQPGTTPIPASGKVIGSPELANLVEAALDGWLTTGRFNDAFERRMAVQLGVKHVLTTNSGSSANLLALAALTSPSLGARALRPGDEVITVAAGFPTTVNPSLLYGLVPVFVDVDIPTYNIDASKIESAISSKTRAIAIAHTLGNPFDLDTVVRIASKHGLWLIEDCCDALGASYSPALASSSSSGAERHVGSFGHIGTLSFYPAHHITMGEGGAVFTNNDELQQILASIRDWGRDCYCAPGKENTCGKRFEWQLGTLPFGYDHKYTYSHLGFNFKITDMQAACALAQMDRLPGFVAARRRNFEFLHEHLKSCEEFLILPERTPKSNPSWFGFPITLRPEAAVDRVQLLRYLDQHKIGTRLLFGGNLTRQPFFEHYTYRVADSLARTDIVMNNAFWIGVFPGLTLSMLEYVVDRFDTFFARKF